MEHANLTDYVRFAEAAPQRQTVFESERLWSQVVCVDRNQTYGPVTDRSADAMVTVLAGQAVAILGKRRKRLKQWGATLAPAGTELRVTNASADPLVLLVVTAPPPAGGTD